MVEVEASLSAQSPEVVRWNHAVGQLDVAAALLVRDLPSASPARAADLAERARAARVELARAFAKLQVVL